MILAVFLMGCTSPKEATVAKTATQCGESDHFLWPVWIDNLYERNQGAVLMKIPEEHRVRFLSAYNAKEPMSNDNPPRLYMFSHPASLFLIIVGVENGCVILTQQMSIPEFKDILEPMNMTI